MTYPTPGQEPQQPSYTGEQPGYGAQQPGYPAPQQPYAAPQQPTYAAPQYSIGQQSYAGYAAPVPKSDKTTFGLWSLILGLSGFLLPFFINSIAAIVLGIVGLTKENAKGMSITGIITGAVNLLFWAPLVWFVILPGLLFVLGLPFLIAASDPS